MGRCNDRHAGIKDEFEDIVVESQRSRNVALATIELGKLQSTTTSHSHQRWRATSSALM